MHCVNTFRAIVIAASLAAVVGCASFGEHDAGAKVLVSYATLKVIEQGDTPEAQHVRAQKIREIASQAKTFLAGESVTIGLLETAIRDQIGTLQLSPADAFLADALVNSVIAELRERIGSGILSEDQLYQVSTVMEWVINATAFAG